jgi:D-3-phosphoglycerate dehydrogenase
MTADGPVVLIWDPIRDLDWSYERERELLAADGVQLVVPITDRAGMKELERADVLIVSDPFPADLLVHLDRCVGIICYSVGMDKVDADAAAAANIPVTNVAGYCTDEVSDHAMALLLAAQRRLLPFARSADRGEWDVYAGADFYGIRRMRGQTVGIIGLGRIGSQVAVKCAAFGMTVIAYDPYLSQPSVGSVELTDLDVLLARSDVVILCSALTDSSRSLLDADRIAKMRAGAVLVNVARGGLVDESALADALASGRLSAAALDVRAKEPPDADGDPLRGRPNVLLTQHIAATSQEARDDLHVFAARRAMELLTDAGRVPARTGSAS